MVAGSGNVTANHLAESLAEWIFGPVDEREVHVILPLFSNMGGGIRNLIKQGIEWEFKFTVIQSKNAPMTRELSSLPESSFFRMDDEREALNYALDLLAGCHSGGDETAFIMSYDPKNTYEQGNPALSDFEIIGDVKNYPWLTTLNLCEGLIDSFEGYKTTDEIIEEERLKREFDEQQAAIEAAKPKPAEKASAPRKRAAKAVVAAESKPLVTEAEKLLAAPSKAAVQEDWNPHEHVFVYGDDDNGNSGSFCSCGMVEEKALSGLDKVVADAVKKDKARREALLARASTANANRTQLSANVVLERPELVPDVWSDVAKAHAQTAKPGYVMVSKTDLADLSEAFSTVMSIFTRILQES
jgi:hypothetical protein